MSETTLVLPVLDDGNRTFWEGCREGVLRLQCCECGHLRYPISPVCPCCLSAEFAWEEVTGLGEIFSFAVFRHVYNDAWRDRVPYAVALVQLDAGPTLIGNLISVDLERISVGMPVQVAFEWVTDEIARPCFTSREADA